MANKSVIRTPASVEPIADRSGVCWIFAPCTDEDCDHLCCQQYREEAAMVCPVCGEAIGYDSAHIFCDGYYVHAGCTVDMLLAGKPENGRYVLQGQTYGGKDITTIWQSDNLAALIVDGRCAVSDYQATWIIDTSRGDVLWSSNR